MSIESANEKSPELLPWAQVEEGMQELIPVEGGNSDAQRGIVTLPNGKKIFVKIGVNEHTKGWANKEIRSYAFLKENNYSYIPEFLSVNAEETGFAIEALPTDEGWDWSDSWNKERLDATLAAMDALAVIQPDQKYGELLRPVITDSDNGWIKLFDSPELQGSLATKLEATGHDILNELSEHTKRASTFRVQHDTLVHDDVRADNCPWNRERGEVRLVDWNWLELGDKRVDLAATLTHIQKSGFDVLPHYSDRLDPAALHWMAGFWLYAASKPIWEGGPGNLRNAQLLAGTTALGMARQLS